MDAAMSQFEPVELDLLWIAETALAYGVKDSNDASKPDTPLIWLPKSQVDIEHDAEISDICTFLVPEWLAIEKGLV